MLLPDDWIKKYPQAAADLVAMLRDGMIPAPSECAGWTEKAVGQRLRAQAFAAGSVLWRNNVGALQDARGVPVRYGLMNESAAMNARLKSPDYIGVRPVLIQQHHVGTVIGQFLARETKAADWVYTGTPHEIAQLNAINLIRAYFGDANFTTGAF